MMQRSKRKFCLVIFVLHGLMVPTAVSATDSIVATLSQVSGFVEVTLARDQKSETGKDGLLLYAGDVVRTRNGSASIIFRGGSETRLFENTELVITESKELSAGYSFKLTKQNLEQLQDDRLPETVIDQLHPIQDQVFTDEKMFLAAIRKQIGNQQADQYKSLLLVRATKTTEERTFRHKLKMVAGAIWGKFVKRRQKTIIKTSIATIGVKGTVFRINDDGNEARISVVEGSVSVENETSSIILNAGKKLQSFNKSDPLAEKIEDIPYRLSLHADNYQLEFRTLAGVQFRIRIQMVDVFHGNNVRRAGKVYLQSNYYNILFPKHVMLNQNGTARIPVQIKPPHPSDRQFDGKIVVWAVMDGANYDDVGEGNLFFNVKMPGKRKEIMIDVDGRITPPTE